MESTYDSAVSSVVSEMRSVLREYKMCIRDRGLEGVEADAQRQGADALNFGKSGAQQGVGAAQHLSLIHICRSAL